MKRILVIGHPGAGKSIFTSKLGMKTGLPVIHLDQVFWRPGWVQTPKNEWRQQTEMLVDRDEWIIDGSYDRTLDIRLMRADTVIFLDYPRFLCMWRVVKRIAGSFGKVRPDMADGCPEKIDLGFLRFVWNYRRDRYPIVLKCLQTHYANGDLIVFKHPANAMQFLNEAESGL